MSKDSYWLISGSYDFLTSIVFFGQMEKAKFRHLDHIKENDQILILGGGTGAEIGVSD